jgi:hypothetical protein
MRENENDVDRIDFDVAGKAGQKNQTHAMYQVLFDFARMNSHNRKRFISLLNEFLMLSPQAQKQFMSEWAQLIVEKR